MKSSKRLALAAAAWAMASGSALASSAGGLPPVQHSGSVAYVNGGIGVREANAMQRASAHWPMSLEFAVRTKHRAEFDSDVKAMVKDSTGRAVLSVDSAGPFLLAKVPPGRYEVDATLGGRTMRRSIDVKPGRSAKAEFVWPAGTRDGNA